MIPDAWRAAGWRDPAEPPPAIPGGPYSDLVLVFRRDTHGDARELSRFYPATGWGGEIQEPHGWRPIPPTPQVAP